MPTLPLGTGWDRRDICDRRAAPIVIGLVNNMPDGALRATERQFRSLLAAAAGDHAVRLRVFSLPGLPRGIAGRQHVAECHEPIAALWAGGLDGLIVTGTEPRGGAIEHEPYWPSMTRLIDWAEQHTVSAIWSCLAAHAAVRHLDGIERRLLERKLSGVFDCTRTGSHPLLGPDLTRWCVPHSRHNGLAEADLTAHGYRVLSRSRAAGADLFVKRRHSLFVFLQGHPEYEPGTLLREYRRDVVRYLTGERDQYPAMPQGYFGKGATAAMQEFEARARRQRDPELLADFPDSVATETLAGPWRGAAVQLFTNWLRCLGDERQAGFDRAALLQGAGSASALKASYA